LIRIGEDAAIEHDAALGRLRQARQRRHDVAFVCARGTKWGGDAALCLERGIEGEIAHRMLK
jgi:hypothetical protein